jgi:hypothetical protein
MAKPTHPTLLDLAKRYGELAVQPSNALAMLALDAARAVTKGKATPDDADRLYVLYYDAVRARSKTQSRDSRKSQVSKLRQVMRLADEWGEYGVTLLEHVIRMHGDAMRAGAPAKPLFAAMVDAARAQRVARQRLTDNELSEIIVR